MPDLKIFVTLVTQQPVKDEQAKTTVLKVETTKEKAEAAAFRHIKANPKAVVEVIESHVHVHPYEVSDNNFGSFPGR